MNRLCPSKVQTYIQIFRMPVEIMNGVLLVVMDMAVEAGALELSNVDVAREFSKLVPHSAHKANSRMVFSK